MWWPLALTYICKVIWPWLWKSYPLCNVFSSRYIICWLGIQYDSIVWVIMRRLGVSSERRRSSFSSFKWNHRSFLLLIPVRPCPLLSTIPLPGPVLTYCHLETSMYINEVLLKICIFSFMKCSLLNVTILLRHQYVEWCKRRLHADCVGLGSVHAVDT